MYVCMYVCMYQIVSPSGEVVLINVQRHPAIYHTLYTTSKTWRVEQSSCSPGQKCLHNHLLKLSENNSKPHQKSKLQNRFLSPHHKSSFKLLFYCPSNKLISTPTNHLSKYFFSILLTNF